LKKASILGVMVLLHF